MDFLQEYKVPIIIGFWAASMVFYIIRCERYKKQKQQKKTKLFYTKYNVYY